MKFAAVFIVTLAIVTGGEAQQSRGESPFTCHAHCAFRRACPTSNQIFATIRVQDFNCRNCIERTCGSSNRLNRRLEVALCMYRARQQCESCFLSPASLRYRTDCQQCLDTCEGNTGTGGNGGGVIGRNGTIDGGNRGQGSGPELEGQGEVVPGDGEVPIPTTPQTSVEVDTSPARPRGGTIPAPTPGRRRPGGSRPHSGRRPIGPGGNIGRFGPHSGGRIFPDPCNCFRTGRCPSIFVVNRQIAFYNGLCRTCIYQNCGRFSGNQNRNEYMSCIFRTRSNCNACPRLPNVIFSCRICLERCPNPDQGGGSTVTPAPTMPTFPEVRTEQSCREACTGNTLCPNANAIMFAFSRFPRACRECADRVCGDIDRGSRQEFADCRFQARMSCNECEINEREMLQRERCVNCLRDCATEEVQCPGNQVFSTCATCFTTCEERNEPQICTLECRQQCTCPPDTFLEGDMCLTADQCPPTATGSGNTGGEITVPGGNTTTSITTSPPVVVG